MNYLKKEKNQSSKIIRLTLAFFAFALLTISQNVFAEQKVCVSNHSLPKHCSAGDIIVVRPGKVAMVCDFSREIVELKPSEKTSEFLCVYTGNILKIKHGPKPPPKQQFPQKRKKKKKMPFFN